MNETTTTTDTNETAAPTTEAAPAPTNGDTEPAAITEPTTDPVALELAALKKERDELAAYRKKTEDAKLSEQEQTAKRQKEAADKVALLEREATFLEAGLPKAWAASVDPSTIAKYIENKIKDAGKARNAGQNISPAGSGTSGTKEQPGDDAKKLDKRYQDSPRWQRTRSQS